MFHPLQRRSIRSWIILGALILATAVAGGALVMLYLEGRRAASELAQVEARDVCLRAQARVDQLLHAAEMCAEAAVRTSGGQVPAPESWPDLFLRLVPAVEQRPELRHLGFTLDSSGEAAVISRDPKGAILLFVASVDTLGRRTVRTYAYSAGSFHLDHETPWLGSDMRDVPPYRLARTRGHGGWSNPYLYSGPISGPSHIHVTYSLPVFDAHGSLAGVWDASLDSQSLREFMQTLHKETGAVAFVSVTLKQGACEILADPLSETVTLANHQGATPAALLGLEAKAAFPWDRSGAWVGQTLALDPSEPPWTVAALLPASPSAIAFRQRQGWLLVAVLAGTVLVAVAGSTILAHALSRPVELLRGAVARARTQAYERPVLPASPREIVELERAFAELVNELGARQRRLARHLSNTPLAVIDWNGDGRISGWNHSAELIFGWTAAEALERDPALLFPPSELDEFWDNWKAMHHGRATTRHYARNTARDGREVDCEWYATAVLGEDGRTLGVSCLVLDISGRVSAEHLFHESEERFQKTFRRGPVAQAIIRLGDNTILDVNERWESVFAISRRRAVGRTADELGMWSLNPGDRQRMMSTLDTEGELREAEFQLVRGNGEAGTFLVSITLLNLVSDPAMLTSLVDITDRSRAAQQAQALNESLEVRVARRTAELAHANAQLKELDRLKSEFLATMSHELRTPLNSIIGFSSILHQGIAGPLNEEQDRQIDMVLGSARHLHALINDLLDLSRIEAGRMEILVGTCSVGEVLAEIGRSLAPMVAGKGIDYITTVDPNMEPIQSDRKRLFQVFLNLISNAVKFTEKGGVTISARSDPGGGAVVEITDTGIGIRRENLPSLFEAFRQVDGSARRDFEGTGLGLYLVRKLLTLLGGTIQVQSEYGRGSIFTVVFPRELSQPASKPPTPCPADAGSAAQEPFPAGR